MKHALALIAVLARLHAANAAEITSALTLRFDETDASPVSLRNAAGEELPIGGSGKEILYYSSLHEFTLLE